MTKREYVAMRAKLLDARDRARRLVEGSTAAVLALDATARRQVWWKQRTELYPVAQATPDPTDKNDCQ